ncbi:uncharacterized protein [Eucyclogobius newberryi]|uniref:uncharacterized protein n=1 Tax=Eucyclogobius newberryi TaxID=166745 RepID=UPI003B594B55
MDFMTNFHNVQRKVVSCDYTLGNRPSSLSLRSEQYELSVFMSKYYPNQLHVTTAPSDPVKTPDPKQETGSDSEAVRPVERTKVTTAPSDPVKTTDQKHETGSDSEAVDPSERTKVTTAPSDPVKTTDPQHETGSDSETVDTTKVKLLHVTTAPSDPVKTTGSNPAKYCNSNITISLSPVCKYCKS